MEKRKDTKSLVEHIFTVKNFGTRLNMHRIYAFDISHCSYSGRQMIVSLDAAIIRS